MNLTGQKPYQKDSKKPSKPKIDRSNWDKIRALGCIICGSNNAHLHHALTGSGGRKDDSKVLPLCYVHHQGELGIHTLGRKKWQAEYGSEEELLITAERLLVMTDSF